ncbi:MAG: EAL domain-containing protein [Cyanobacteria bacterium]|nr:EAL domain-containing protein [Cyanobacteriota bacterium]
MKPTSDSSQASHTAKLPIRADVVELLRKAGVEFFRIPVAPEGEAMRAYFDSPAHIPCHFGSDDSAGVGSARILLDDFLARVHPEDRDHMEAVAAALVASEGQLADISSNRFRAVAENGQWCWYEIRISAWPQDGLQICEGLIINVEEQELARLQLERLAFQDPLTGLPNTKAMVRHLEALLPGQADPRPGLAASRVEPTSVIWLDLSGFGRYNYIFGRDKGDVLLLRCAEIFAGWLQVGDLLVRPGDDEFAIVLPGRDCAAAAAAAHHLQRYLQVGFGAMGEQQKPLGFHAGVASYPRHAASAEALLRHATTALDSASREGPEAIVVYSDALTQGAIRALSMEQGLQQAIARRELELVFQPQVDGDGGLIGCEALLRWHSEQLGPVSPGCFIPLAEETGMIREIGQWVVDEACRQQAGWVAAGLLPPPLKINLSAIQLAKSAAPGFAACLSDAMQRHQLQPGSLHIEITETVAVSDDGFEQLRAIHDAGFPISIDDFGTGYASLSSLLKVPIHTIKVDQSFVAEMHTSTASQAILRASLAIASSIGAEALVEGVEESWQRDLLTDLGFRWFQGYFFARPMKALAYADLLARARDESLCLPLAS